MFRCAHQLFLRFEWLLYIADHFIQQHPSVDWPVVEITQFLRMISLNNDVGDMKNFLRNALVELYV